MREVETNGCNSNLKTYAILKASLRDSTHSKYN